MTTSRLEPDAAVIVAAIASGATHAIAAEVAGCSPRTVRRRLADPTVRAALDAERSRLAQEIADALTGRARAAVERLARVIETGQDRDAVSAARVLLDQTVKHRDHVYVTDQLAEAEARLAATAREAQSG